MTRTYGVRSRAMIYKFAMSFQRIAKSRVAAQSRTGARTRSRSDADPVENRDERRDAARRRVENGREEPERATARGRAQLTRALQIKASVAARRVHLSRVHETVNQNDDTWEDARGGSVNSVTFKSLYDRSASRFRTRQIPPDNRCKHASGVTSRRNSRGDKPTIPTHTYTYTHTHTHTHSTLLFRRVPRVPHLERK